MNANNIQEGDEVLDSPVGPGFVTDITDAGYPRVNDVAVTWLKRADGAVFDPFNRVGGSCGPQEN